MSTKMGFWRWALASAAILMVAGTASARVIDPTGVTTNEPTALLLYPQLKVDEVEGVDTLVQLTNTSEFLTKVHCLYTNTNGHCSNAPETICTDANFRSVCPAGGLCVPGWVETNFRLTLTKRQPISWSVNDGMPQLPLATTPGQGVPPQFNEGNIPAAPEVPFTGELFCVQVDVTTELPTDRNDLKGEATIVKTTSEQMDARKYTAIGIKAIEGRQDGNPTVLNVGGPEAEYGVFNETVDPARFAGCPNVFTLNHFFDGAEVETHDGEVVGDVTSNLTIVPCARDYINQDTNPATVQFLIFNEFEQRFSSSTKIDCYKEVQLSDIDTRPGPEGNAFSIFAAGVQGTLTGMSRVRSVPGPEGDEDEYDARGILVLLTENWAAGVCADEATEGATSATGGWKPPLFQLCVTDADCTDSDVCVNAGTKTTSANVQFQGSRRAGDRILVPLP